MNKYHLIGISIIASGLLFLGSLSNVVGYKSVQSSNQNTITNKANKKELLFQTIVDIANNKEIQRIILKSYIIREGFFNSNLKFSGFNTPILKKNNLKQMYVIGLLLSKTFSKSRIHSMMEQYQLSNQGMQKEITDVIERDDILNGEMTQLSNSECDCENRNTTRLTFDVLCILLFPLFCIFFGYWVVFHSFHILYLILNSIGSVLNCWWYTSYQ